MVTGPSNMLVPNYGMSFFTRGIAIDPDRFHNISLRDIRNKQHFKQILKKHFLYTYSLAE